MEYFVNGNLLHDGKAFVKGDTIELSEETAQSLIAAGAIATEVAAEPAETEPEAAKQADTSSTKTESGEPSIDGAAPDPGADTAKDVTPRAPGAPTDGMRALSPDVGRQGATAPAQGSEAPVEPTEDMKREELEQLAVAKGISATDAAGAPNKAALVELIKGTQKQPERDPSAGL